MSANQNISSDSMKEESQYSNEPNGPNDRNEDRLTMLTPTSGAAGTHQLVKPKRPLSAYNMFFRDQRELLLESLPSRGGRKPKRSHGKINFNDLAKTIAAKWKEISPEEKEKYEKVAAVGREKYLKLAKAWKKQQRKLAKLASKTKQRNAIQAASANMKPAPRPQQLAGQQPTPQHVPSSEVQWPMIHTSHPNEPHASHIFNEPMSERAMSSRLNAHFSYRDPDYDGQTLHTQRMLESGLDNVSRASTLQSEMYARPDGIIDRIPSSEPQPAFEDIDSDPVHGFSSEYQNMNRRPGSMLLPVSFLNTNVGSDHDSPDRLQESMPVRSSMPLPQMINVNPSWDVNTLQSQQLPPSLPFPPTSGTDFSLQSPTNFVWQHNMDPPRRHHSLPLPTSDHHTFFRSASDTLVPAFQRSSLPTGNFPNERTRMISQSFHSLPEEPMNFNMPTGGVARRSSIGNNTTGQEDDCDDQFVGIFDEPDDL